MIDVDPLELSFELESRQSDTQMLSIANSGDAALSWTGDIFWNGGEENSWLSIDPPDGIVLPDDNMAVQVRADSAGLDADEYSAVIRIASNDPETPSIEVSVFLTVNAAGPVDDGVFDDRFEK